VRWVRLAKAGLQVRLAAIPYNIRGTFGILLAASA
jgi:hypothetical protein